MEDEAPREATPASQDPAAPLNSAPATTVSSDASDASASPVAALANDLKYTLTVEQGRSIFAANQRKVPAVRTLQNYCVEGRIAAKKISTSYGQEWLLNETSLLAFIENEPQLTAAPQATPASQDPAAPLNSAPATTASSDASDASAVSVGERRTLADVLIENAKLFAQVDGKEQMIIELKDDRGFLREEVREARKTRDDVKQIAVRMLETLESVSRGNRSLPATGNTQAPTHVHHQDITDRP